MADEPLFPTGMAQLPRLTYDELATLLDAIAVRMSTPGGHKPTLWSLHTAVAEAMYAAELDAKRTDTDA